MLLLCIEVGNDETQVELLRLAFALQQMALDGGVGQQQQMSFNKVAGIHSMVARFMSLAAQLLSIPALYQHVQQVIQARDQRAHPMLLSAKSTPRALAPAEEAAANDGGAFSPPAGKAPIAHMDSEDDFGPNSQGTTARKQTTEVSVGQCDKLDLADEPELLFSEEIVFEAIKASNKEAQRLRQPFKPLASSQSVGTSLPLGREAAQMATGGSPSMIVVSPPDLTAADQSAITTSSTSGGLMFSSPLNSRRNMSAMEISGMLRNNNNEGHPPKSDTDLLQMQKQNGNKPLSQQNSMDTTSVGSSSVDWSPPDSNIHSRRNTIFSGGQQKELDLPITVEQLRILANTPLDLAEEERRDQEKSREVLKLFRNKDAKELCALFRRQHRRQCSCSSTAPTCPHGEAAGEETLAQTLQRLTTRHEEKTKIRMYGQQAPPATIFDIKFPSSFEF